MCRSLLLAVLAGLVVGTLLAGLPHTGNELCLHDPLGGTEGASVSGGAGLWPYGTRCEFEYAGRSSTIDHAAGVAEGLAWVALASLLFAAALLRRTAAARGAAVAAGVLALVGFAWHFAGEGLPALVFAVIVGPPLAFVVDRWLRPRGERGWTSLRAAAVVFPTALFAWTAGFFFDLPYLAIAAGLGAGALASAAASAWRRPSAAAVVAP